MGSRNRRHLVVLLASLLVLAVVGSALAAARVLTSTSASGRFVTLVQAISDGSGLSVNSTSFVDVPGASATISIPSSTTGFILIHFAASTSCGDNFSNPPGTTPCYLRALINSADVPPGAVVFDSWPSNGGLEPGAHAMDWSSASLSPGTYTVRMQAATSSLNPSPTGAPFFLSAWHLTVERVTT